MFKAMNNLLPAAFTNFFTLNSNVHSHETRSSSNIHVLGFSLNVRQASIKCHCTSVLNTLPLAVRLSTTFTIFKRCLRCNITYLNDWIVTSQMSNVIMNFSDVSLYIYFYLQPEQTDFVFVYARYI